MHSSPSTISEYPEAPERRIHTLALSLVSPADVLIHWPFGTINVVTDFQGVSYYKDVLFEEDLDGNGERVQKLEELCQTLDKTAVRLYYLKKEMAAAYRSHYSPRSDADMLTSIFKSISDAQNELQQEFSRRNAQEQRTPGWEFYLSMNSHGLSYDFDRISGRRQSYRKYALGNFLRWVQENYAAVEYYLEQGTWPTAEHMAARNLFMLKKTLLEILDELGEISRDPTSKSGSHAHGSLLSFVLPHNRREMKLSLSNETFTLDGSTTSVMILLDHLYEYLKEYGAGFLSPAVIQEVERQKKLVTEIGNSLKSWTIQQWPTWTYEAKPGGVTYFSACAPLLAWRKQNAKRQNPYFESAYALGNKRTEPISEDIDIVRSEKHRFASRVFELVQNIWKEGF